MFIKSLTIKNFRCFGKGDTGKGTKINFNNNLTAFIGRNGSGKTAILEALNYLIGLDYLPTKISEKDFHTEAKNIKDRIVIEGKTKKFFLITLDVRSNTNQLERVAIPCNKIKLVIKRREKAEKVLDDPFIINKYVLPSIEGIKEDLFKIDGKTRKVLRINFIEKGYRVFFRLKSGEERSANIMNYQLTYNPNNLTGCPRSYYLSKERGNDVSGNYSFIARILTNLNWKYTRGKANTEKAVTDTYKELAKLLRDTADGKDLLLDSINKRVKEICSTNKDFQIHFLDIEQPYKSAFVAKKEGKKLLLPTHLGSGFNILIAYALFACIAKQEKVPIVLIIDEPELHMHSDWQKKMYKVFAKQSNLQFVYSTQSENFISFKNWRQIRSISNFKIFPKKEILQEGAVIRGEQSNSVEKYLDDYAEKNLDISTILKENLELFFTKKCILVEGPSEKYGLPKLLKLFDCDIQKFSVSIIPTWGKTKIKIYQMICKAFNIDYFTIYDGDEMEGKNYDNEENKLIEDNAKGEQKICFSTNFEEKLEAGKSNKFQSLVKQVDRTTDINTLDREIKTCLVKLKSFIEDVDDYI